MMIFCDFDHTLYNTTALGESYQKICGKYGISGEQWDHLLTHFSRASHEEGTLFSNANFAQIAAGHHKVNAQMLENELTQCITDNGHLWNFSDTVDFLTLFKAESIAIITFGEEIFQTQKIDAANIRQYIGDVLITGGEKTPVIESYVTKNNLSGQLFFLDDKAEYFASIKEVYPDLITILVDHKERKKVALSNAYCDHVVTSLLAAGDVIEKYLDTSTKSVN